MITFDSRHSSFDTRATIEFLFLILEECVSQAFIFRDNGFEWRAKAKQIGVEEGKENRKVDKLLKGARVFLRVPESNDRDEFIALNKMSVDLHRGLASPPVEPQQFQEYLEKSRRSDCAYLAEDWRANKRS